MAVFQYAGAYATDSLQWAVNEASRCFQAPLDHTRHGPVEPLPEMVNTPTGNPYFDRMLKSDVGLRFLELTDSHSCAGGIDDAKGSEGKNTALDALSSCFSVVVVKEDGSRARQSITFDASEGQHQQPDADASADAGSIDDTLTKRSSPSAVAAAVQTIMEQCKVVVDASPEPTQQDEAPEVHKQSPTAGSCNDLNAMVSEGHPGEERHMSPELETLARVIEEVKLKVHIADESPAAKAEHIVATPTSSISQVDEDRDSWQVGTVIEVYSASNGRWFPALVTQAVRTKTGKEMLTTQFWLNIEEAKQKSLARDSDLLASIGTHCGDQLPPGFQIGASKSRPGMLVFLDATTGLKYNSLELVWAVHFKRWLDQPTDSCVQTIDSVAPAVSRLARVTSEPSADAEMAGLVTRVVQEDRRQFQAMQEVCEQPQVGAAVHKSASSSCGALIDPGFEDVEAWSAWMPQSRQRLEDVDTSKTAPPAVENFDPWAPWTTAASSASYSALDDIADGPPEDEFIARPSESTARQSPLNLAASLTADPPPDSAAVH